MKKNVIAIILSIVLSLGNMGAVPALAAESTGDGQTIVEVSDPEVLDETADDETGQEAQGDPVEAAEEKEDDSAASEDSAFEDTASEGTASGDVTSEDNMQEGEDDIKADPEDGNAEKGASSDESGVIEEDADSDDTAKENEEDASSEEVSADEEADDGDSLYENDILTDGESDEIAEEQDQEETAAEEQKEGVLINGESAKLDLDIGFGSPQNQLYGDLWFSYSDLLDKCQDVFYDDGFYRDSEYKGVITGGPEFKLTRYDGSALKEFSSADNSFVNVTKTYYLIVRYPVSSTVTIDSGSTIKVNGQAVKWSCSGGYLQFMLTAYQGRSQALELDNDDNGAVCAGDSFSLRTSEYNGEISAARTSNAAVLKMSYTSDQVNLVALKPGTASITVTGKNGLSCTLKFTVKSFITASSVTINSGSGKYISFVDEYDSDYDLDYDFRSAYDYTYTVSNSKVVSISKDDDSFKVVGKYPGTATITLKGKKNETSSVTVVVKPALASTTKTPKVIYGATSITNKTTPGAKVTAKIGKKTYKATAAANGKYTIKIPVVKIGTKIKMKFSSANTSLAKTVTVKKSASKIETTAWVYKDSSKVKGKTVKVHKGDYIKIKINGRTYKKKIKKNANSFKFSIKIKKPNKYGIRMTTELYNKFNQRLSIEKEYVYKSNYVYVGDSKATVKWLTGWNDPYKRNYYSTGEQWCYDWDGDGFSDAFLYFRNGKVSDWYTSE